MKKSAISYKSARTGQFVDRRDRVQERAGAESQGGFEGHPFLTSLMERKAAWLLCSKEEKLLAIAARVMGSPEGAQAWYEQPNEMLGGRAPKQAVAEGEEKLVFGLLMSVAGQ